jgi:hypothetical protein
MEYSLFKLILIYYKYARYNTCNDSFKLVIKQAIKNKILGGI